MPDETITVEWIATAQKMEQVLLKLDQKFDKQEKALKKLGDAGKKGGIDAATGFNKLEMEFKEAEKALKKLDAGTAAFARQKQKVDALRQSLVNAKTQMGATGSAIGGVMQSGVAKIAQLAAGMIGFQAIVSAVVSELEKVKQLKLDAVATTKTFEQALADVGQNIGAEAIPQAREMILDQAPKLGVDQDGLANLISIAISAGAKDLTEAMQLSSAALKVTAGSAERAATLVGGTLDVASLGGSKNFEGALGQLLQVQSQVRSTNLAEFAKNIGPGLAAATAQGQNMQGVSTERALEMSSVISQIIKDQSGANTATTLRQFFTRLDSFAPEQEKKLDDGGMAKVTQAQIDAFKGAKTFDQRLEMMRQNEPLRLQFLETQRESIGKTAVREIITDTPRAAAFEQKAAMAISAIDDAQSTFTDLANAVELASPHLMAINRATSGNAAARVTGERDTAGAVLTIVQDALKDMNLSGSDSEQLLNMRTTGEKRRLQGVSEFDIGIESLQASKQQRKLFGAIPIGGQVSAEDKATADRAIKAIESLRETLDRAAAMEANRQVQQPQPIKVVVPPQRPKEAPLPAVSVP